MRDRVLALAGLCQSVACVEGLATDGDCDRKTRETIIASLFRLDAPDTDAVYDGVRGLARGLDELGHQLNLSGDSRGNARRIAFTVLQVERRLALRRDLLETIRRDLIDIDRQREHFGLLHSTVQARLGDLYASTVSKLSPRVLVQGNPAQLSQTAVVAQIRAALLAAVRSAVLWRQLGGSYWDFLLRRAQMRETVRRLQLELGIRLPE